ncbi:hypothetical protein DFAR_3920009 [Desulfarculales bacterium]
MDEDTAQALVRLRREELPIA